MLLIADLVLVLLLHLHAFLPRLVDPHRALSVEVVGLAQHADGRLVELAEPTADHHQHVVLPARRTAAYGPVIIIGQFLYQFVVVLGVHLDVGTSPGVQRRADAERGVEAGPGVGECRGVRAVEVAAAWHQGHVTAHHLCARHSVLAQHFVVVVEVALLAVRAHEYFALSVVVLHVQTCGLCCQIQIISLRVMLDLQELIK